MLVQFAAMRQIALIAGKIDLTALAFSHDSLISYMYGSITYEGREVATNAVFSLISYMPQDVTITAGERNHWPGQGLLIVWSNNLDSFDEWNGEMNADHVKLVDMNTQFAIDVGYIFIEGKPAPSVTLKADTMERMGLLNLTQYQSHPVPQIRSTADVVIQVILIIIVMLILLYVCTRLGPVGAVIALFVLIIGSLFILSVTGILQNWIRDILFGWWPFR
jgi:hypothetical protein